MKNNIRHILGMPSNNNIGIDKSDPRRIECANCVHEKKLGVEYPCLICWDPIGDMFEPKVKEIKPSRLFVPCQCCGGRGEVEKKD